MIKWLLAATLILGLGLCGQMAPYKLYERRELKMPYISPELLKPVLEFVSDMEREGIDISGIEKLDSIIIVPNSRVICESRDAIGCAWRKSVCIKKYWSFKFLDAVYFKVLIYHELGHAILKLRHFSGRFHLMNPSLHGDLTFYEVLWPYLKNEYIRYYHYSRYSNYFLPL